MQGCSEIQDMLYSFTTGECDPETAKAIRAHVNTCPACSAELARLRQVIRLTGALEPVKPSRDLLPEIRSRMRAHFYWLKVAGAAAAAAVLMIAFLYSITGPMETDTKPATEKQAGAEKTPENIKLVEKPESPGEAPENKHDVAKAPEKLPEIDKEPEIADKPEIKLPEKKPVKPELPQESEVAKAPEPAQKKVEEKAPVPEPEKPVVLAKIGSLSGEVKVKRHGGNEWLEAAALFAVQPGDTLETNPLGRMRIDFENGDSIYINNNSQITITSREEEVAIEVEKGEVYVQKDTPEGSVVLNTCFGEVRSGKGRFNLKMFGKNKGLLHVASGEVECREASKGYCLKYGDLTHAWLRCGKRCEKGAKIRTNEAFRWIAKLQPKQDKPKTDKHAEKPAGKGKKDDTGIPPGVPPKPDGKHQPGSDKPGGKAGPGPAPIPPKPGGDGPHGPSGGPKLPGGQGTNPKCR